MNQLEEFSYGSLPHIVDDMEHRVDSLMLLWIEYVPCVVIDQKAFIYSSIICNTFRLDIFVEQACTRVIA